MAKKIKEEKKKSAKKAAEKTEKIKAMAIVKRSFMMPVLSWDKETDKSITNVRVKGEEKPLRRVPKRFVFKYDEKLMKKYNEQEEIRQEAVKEQEKILAKAVSLFE